MGEGAGDGVEELFRRMRPSDRMRVSLCSFPPFFCKEGPAGEGRHGVGEGQSGAGGGAWSGAGEGHGVGQGEGHGTGQGEGHGVRQGEGHVRETSKWHPTKDGPKWYLKR